MIAEDDLLMADMLENTLTANGYEVCGIARTVEKAVELWERYDPDLAVLDIRLADGGLGTDIPARLTSRGHMGILYASGHAGQMVLTSVEGDALIVKPYRPDDVIRGLRIVEQIISDRNAPRHFPNGFSILDAGPKGAIASQFFDADVAAQNRRLRREQSELARFSTFAAVCRDLDRVLSEAARISAECMSVPHCAIYRYRPEENDLLIAAGFGWDHQTIGRVSSRADGSTPHGRAFTGGNPVICDSLSADAGIVRPRLYVAHGIVTTLSVPIISYYQPSGSQNGPLANLPYGVLEIASSSQPDYNDHHIEFLSCIASIAAAAVDAAKRDTAFRVTTDRLQDVSRDQRIFRANERLATGRFCRRMGSSVPMAPVPGDQT
jgi:DNA-binding response OmpR family regulator